MVGRAHLVDAVTPLGQLLRIVRCCPTLGWVVGPTDARSIVSAATHTGMYVPVAAVIVEVAGPVTRLHVGYNPALFVPDSPDGQMHMSREGNHEMWPARVWSCPSPIPDELLARVVGDVMSLVTDVEVRSGDILSQIV